MRNPLHCVSRTASVVAAVLLSSPSANAGIAVTTLADENQTPPGAAVSLREAVAAAASGEEITLSPALAGGVLIQSLGPMDVTGKDVVINMPGGLVIEARGVNRIFTVSANASLTLTGLTLQGGSAPDHGGAILSAGPLTLTDCTLRENRAADGTAGAKGAPGVSGGGSGAVGNPGGSGGAIYSTASVTALRCRFIGNAAGNGGQGGAGGDVPLVTGFERGGVGGKGGTGGAGGAVFSTSASTFTACLFALNESGRGGNAGQPGFPPGKVPGNDGGAAGDGGAILGTGPMTVSRCTFLSNSSGSGGNPVTVISQIGPPTFGGSAGTGSAIRQSGGTALVENSTFAHNRVGQSGISTSTGGTVYFEGPGARMVYCTITRNVSRSDSFNGGWYAPANAGVSGAAQCENCILSGNFVEPVGQSSYEANGSPAKLPFSAPGTDSGVDQQLGPLSSSGVLPPVLIPAATAPALNTGALLTGAPAEDERGLPRAVGQPDGGAVERQADELPALAYQSVTFAPPAVAATPSTTLTAMSSAALPVSFELLSGPAALAGNSLTFSAPGFAAVRVTQAGDANTAPALPVVRIIESPHGILFTPASSYAVYPGAAATVTLPLVTTAGLPVTWSVNGVAPGGISLSGNTVTATSAGTVSVRGQNAGNATYGPVDSTWTLAFVAGTVNWQTPPAPGGGPRWYTLVEGSSHGLVMTAFLSATATGPVPVPTLPAGLVATPSVIPAGQSSTASLITAAANSSLSNKAEQVATDGGNSIKIFLVNRTTVPLDIFPPAGFVSGVQAKVDISCPGVPLPGLFGPPPAIRVNNSGIAAFDFDNPSVAVPVTVVDVATGPGIYPKQTATLMFPPMDRRIKLVVTTDDGITGTAGPISVISDTNTDGDGINDVVETALKRPAGQRDNPPLTIEPGPGGLYAVLASRPLDSGGWEIGIELSADLNTWTAASAEQTTRTANPDGLTERVAVLLQGSGRIYCRLKVARPQ